jgi:serine/threonine-protein kinase RsbW
MAGDTSVPAFDPDIRLTLPARPENVAVVRQVVDALAEALALPDPVSEDMRLAVTEACTNVVRHAYNGDEGAIDVIVQPIGDALEVTVSDAGRGTLPSPDSAGPGLGLSLIAALADTLEVERSLESGSRIVMSFVRSRTTPSMGLA